MKRKFHLYILLFSPNSNTIISMTGFFFGRMRKNGSPVGFQSILKMKKSLFEIASEKNKQLSVMLLILSGCIMNN